MALRQLGSAARAAATLRLADLAAAAPFLCWTCGSLNCDGHSDVLARSFDFVLCLVLPMHGLAAVLIALTARTEAQMAALKGGIAGPLSQHLVVEPAICSLNLTVMMTCNYVVVCLAVIWVSQAQAAGLG